MPKITIFTSCFNQGEFLERAMNSVLSQTEKDFEYLVYDDGSTDSSWNIMMDFAERDERVFPMKLDKQKNVGVVINKSFRAAEGRFWCWCPADDRFEPTLLEKKLLLSKKFPSSVIYNDFHAINGDGSYRGLVALPSLSRRELVEALWKVEPVIWFTGVWIPTSLFQRGLEFPEHLSKSEDFFWMLKAVLLGVDFRHLKEVLHFKRIHGNRLTERGESKVEEILEELREFEKEILK